MSTNRFETTAYVLDEVLIRFINYLNFAKVANRNFEGDFKNLKYATGQTINYRLEERYLPGRGATAVSQARVQVIRPLTISTQFNTMVEFTGMQLTFDRARDEPYLDMMLNPRAKTLANDVEKFIAEENFQTQVYQAIGTPGVPIDFLTVANTDAYMTALGIPDDGNRYFANDPFVSASLSDSLKTVFNMTVNRGALLDGFIGHLSGFDFFKTNFVSRQIAGLGQAGGSPPTGFLLAGTVTNGPITGGNTISVTGLGQSAGAAVFNMGDIIEIDVSAGVFMVNPLTYQPISGAGAGTTNQRAQFVVTANVISANGNTADIPVNPTIVVSGARQNISAAIPNGAQILLSQSFNRSIAFHNQAIVFAAPPIKELKGGVECVTSYSDLYKLAITYSLGADIRNYLQLDRVDAIGGVAINPEFAVIVRS
jgi:coat protein Gp5